MRIFVCEEWTPLARYWKFVFCTDDAATADRWRRNGVKGANRKFVDYVVLTAEDALQAGLLEVPAGINQEGYGT